MPTDQQAASLPERAHSRPSAGHWLLAALLLLALLLLSFASRARLTGGASPGHAAFTMAECIALAQARNVTAQRADLNPTAGLAALLQFRANRYPTLNGNSGYISGRSAEPGPNQYMNQSVGSVNASLTGVVTVFNGGRIHNTIHQYEKDLAATRRDAETARRDLSLQVLQGCVAVLQVRELRQAAQVQHVETAARLAYYSQQAFTQQQGPAQATPTGQSARVQALLRDTLAGHLPLIQGPNSQAFYRRRAYAPAWCDTSQPASRGRAALALLGRAEDFGLAPRHYHVGALQALADSLTRPQAAEWHAVQLARFEVLLTDGLLAFAVHLRRGQLHALTPSPLEKAGVPFAPAAWLARAWAAPDFTVALLRCQPQQREYQQLQQALARWRRHPAGPAAGRRRRAQQLAVTLERWRWVAIPDAEYVLVNLPAYQLEVVRHGRVLQTHRLVIGRPANPTPTLSSRLTSFTIAPEWRVPRRIATTQLLPYLQASAQAHSEHDFLAENNYRLFDARGRELRGADVNWAAVTAQNFPYTIRQSPGCGNLLGNVIFPFANPYGVYLNDGPDPLRFAHPYRALGHSCLQLQNPMHLAAYLLGPDTARAALPTEDQCEAAPRPRSFFLKRPVPLHVRYATCAVVAGQLRFYADVYGRDEALRQQLFGRGPARE